MSNKDKIFTFWGLMDVLALASYLFFSVRMGNVPFWSDIQHFYINLAFMEVKGAISILMEGLFFLNLILLVTLFFSAWAFLKKREISLLFISLQEVMRIFSLSCSVAIFPIILRVMHVEEAIVGFILFVVSETFKIGSLLWLRKRNC